MAEDSRKLLAGSLRDILATGQYADLTITCGEDTYKVHRSIVCTRAEFFAGASRFPGTKAADNRINLPNEEPAIVKLLMQYLYEGDYAPVGPDVVPKSPGSSSHESLVSTTLRHVFPHTCTIFGTCEHHLCEHHSCSGNCNHGCIEFICPFCVRGSSAPQPVAVKNMSPADLFVHAKMYAIADRLIVTGLKALAIAKFTNAVELYKDEPNFPPAAEYIFSSTPDTDQGLRKVVTHTISKNKKLVKNATIKKLMAEHNGLAIAILELLAV